ncbi:MAG: TonB-dependent receptor [Bacteroidetes bacterium]|nr:TonB-dependent receptor [Bacteroidota bacterium]
MRRVILFSLLLAFSSLALFAGSTGKLYGVIKDAQTGESLIGVNIVIMGTTLGASSDEDGEYYITLIRPGTYRVQISMIGYQSVIYDEVKIMADISTELNGEIGETSVEMESVVIVAKRPVVQKDQTSTKVVIDGATIADELRAQDVNEVLKLQAGITVGTDGNFHVRGGRTGGTVYQVDGIPLTNPFTRGMSGEVEVENVQELQALLGTFDAEYGNAGDAIINVYTKDGGDDYKVKFTYESPRMNGSPYHEKDWNLNRSDISSLSQEQQEEFKDYIRKPDGTSAYDFVSVLDDPYAEDYTLVNMLGSMSLNISGPVPFMSKLKFVATGRFRNEDSSLPFGYTLSRSAGLKLTYNLSPTFTIRASYNWSQNINQDYNHTYKYWRWWDSGLDTLGRVGSYPIDKVFSNRQLVSLRHVLSPNTFYDLSFSRIYDDESEIVPGRNVVYDELTGELISSDYERRLYVGGNDSNFMYGDVRYWRRTKGTQYLIKGNFDSQVNKNHQVRTGFEYKSHEIFRHRIGMEPRPNLEFFTFKPIEFAAYLQDKIEYSFMILKLGLRFDYFDPKASEYPDIASILLLQNNPDGTTEYITTTREPVKPHYQFSPRIGIAHPISDKTSIHFAYGHFFQIPRFYDLYRNDDLNNILTNDALVGNPGLKPEKTVSYEIGLQQELTPEWGINITAYSKDISNLISSFYYFVGRDYTIFNNADFGRVQGIDVTLDKAFNDYYSFRFTYSLMHAMGNESDPTEGYNNYREGEAHLRPNRNYPLDFDQRHSFNAVFTSKFPDNFGPEILGIYPFEKFSFSAVFSAGSGLPYTPTSRALEETNIVPEPNSARRPWIYNVDLRMSRTIPTDLFDITAYLDIENLFDTINTKYIWSRTGDPWDEGPTSVRPADRQANPGNVGTRRSIRAGFFIEF